VDAFDVVNVASVAMKGGRFVRAVLIVMRSAKGTATNHQSSFAMRLTK
jgi:hypothetical protein